MLVSKSLISEFIKALQREIDALKQGKGGNIVKLFNGRFVRKTADLFVYIFHLENFLAAIDDTPAEIEVNGNRYSCQIISVKGLEVELAVEHNLGQYVAEAKVQTNMWFLLELLRKKFEESSPSDERFQLSEKLFAGTVSSDKDKYIQPQYTVSDKTPNPSQEKAISSSFNEKLSVIWGPPGTGKTKTVAKAIEAHLNAERRVLLVSHANAAVDEALEDVAEQLKQTSFYQEGKLIRLGICSEKLSSRYPLVILDNIAAKMGESLSLEKANLESERDQIESFLETYKNLIEIKAKSEAVNRELDMVRKSISEFSKQLTNANDDLLKLEGKKKGFQQKLQKAQQAGTVKRFFLGLDPIKIRRQIDEISVTIDSKRRAISELQRKTEETKLTLKDKETESTKLAVELNSLLARHGLTKEKLQKSKEDAEKRRDIINSRISEINKVLDEIQKKALSEARLVATTLTKTFSAKQFPDTPFDVLIVDESSMAPLPHLYWAVSRVTSFVTIIGDFNQLPPICVSSDAIAKKWLGRSIFDVLRISTVQEASNDQRVSLLDTQYRMNPKIAEIPNRLFYEGMLHNAPSTGNLILDDPLTGSSPLVLVNTTETNPWCSHLSTGGRFNIYSALVSASIARYLAKNAKLAKIGIVTPYRAQARLISKIAKDWQISDLIRVDTVHSFQGGEEQVIVFDCVEGPGVSKWSMLDDTRKGSNARLLLNVALTRAKRKVFIVSHRDYLFSVINKHSVILRILELFSDGGCEISSQEFIDSYLVTDFDKYATALIETPTSFKPTDSSLYTEKTFWPIFFKDLLSVKKSLLIMSPFASLRRAGQMMDYFRALLNRNVDLRIITRPPSKQGGKLSEHAEEVIKQLEALGATVVQRKGMHQKVAVIDNQVVWEGSLNILSHKDTQEQMRRFEGQNAAEEVVRNLEIDEDEAAGNVTNKLCPACLKNGISSLLVIRKSRFGTFYGCSTYPTCRYTEDLSKRKRR